MMLPTQLIFDLAWAAACLYALARGGTPERLMAGAFLAAGPISALVERGRPALYTSPEVGVIIVDLLLMAFLLWLSLKSCRYWPLLMASMHGVSVLIHPAILLSPDIVPSAYFMVLYFWPFPELALLAVATWRHRGRLGRFGIDYAWVSELPASYLAGGNEG